MSTVRIDAEGNLPSFLDRAGAGFDRMVKSEHNVKGAMKGIAGALDGATSSADFATKAADVLADKFVRGIGGAAVVGATKLVTDQMDKVGEAVRASAESAKSAIDSFEKMGSAINFSDAMSKTSGLSSSIVEIQKNLDKVRMNHITEFISDITGATKAMQGLANSLQITVSNTIALGLAEENRRQASRQGLNPSQLAQLDVSQKYQDRLAQIESMPEGEAKESAKSSLYDMHARDRNALLDAQAKAAALEAAKKAEQESNASYSDMQRLSGLAPMSAQKLAARQEQERALLPLTSVNPDFKSLEAKHLKERTDNEIAQKIYDAGQADLVQEKRGGPMMTREALKNKIKDDEIKAAHKKDDDYIAAQEKAAKARDAFDQEQQQKYDFNKQIRESAFQSAGASQANKVIQDNANKIQARQNRLDNFKFDQEQIQKKADSMFQPGNKDSVDQATMDKNLSDADKRQMARNQTAEDIAKGNNPSEREKADKAAEGNKTLTDILSELKNNLTTMREYAHVS